MLLAANQWNETIARFVIENYSRPFDIVFNGFRDSTVANRVGNELLRCTEPNHPVPDLYPYMRRLPENLIHLLCLDAATLLLMNRSEQQEMLREALRILSPGGCCALLITDEIRSGKLVPNGFQLVHRFLAQRFKVLTIIDQHACQGLPFRLAAHQYLAIFQKTVNRKQAVPRYTPAAFRFSYY
ncbi:hypothetical protein [Effusibacillus pohliae]|uniref:hypothetical protein n=1 Tax=Effusibacillus pohliae TaxID=232270 RepID=UPI0003718B04|nr:hypothetical protein [Effusibacillus pohliae]